MPTATTVVNPFPWVTFGFPVVPLSAAVVVASSPSSLFATQEEPICQTNFEAWEAIIAKDPLNSCWTSAQGSCDDATSLSSCSANYEGFYCQYPQPALSTYSLRIRA